MLLSLLDFFAMTALTVGSSTMKEQKSGTEVGSSSSMDGTRAVRRLNSWH